MHISVLNGWTKFRDEFYIAVAEVLAVPDELVPIVDGPYAAAAPSDGVYIAGPAAAAAPAAAPAAEPSAPGVPSGSVPAAAGPKVAAAPGPSLAVKGAFSEPQSSKAKARAAGKEMFGKYSMGAESSLHAVCRSMCDEVGKQESRIILYLMAPQSAFLGRGSQDNRAAEKTTRFYSELANWSWLQVSRDQADVMYNKRLLERIGLTITLTKKEAAAITAASGIVAWEETVGTALWGTFTSQVQARCGAMLVYTASLPCASAGLLHAHPAVRSSIMRFL